MSDDLTDARLEREIKTAEIDLDSAWKEKNTLAANAALRRLSDLVAKRSPEQIAQMEAERGLS